MYMLDSRITTYMHIYTHINTPTYTYIYTHTHTYMYTYTHIYTYIVRKSFEQLNAYKSQ